VCFSEDPDRPSEYTPLIHWGRLQTTRVCVGDRFIAGRICRFPGIILMPQWLNLNKPLFLCANCSGMDHLVQYLPCMAFLLPGRKLGKHNVQANFENYFIIMCIIIYNFMLEYCCDIFFYFYIWISLFHFIPLFCCKLHDSLTSDLVTLNFVLFIWSCKLYFKMINLLCYTYVM